MIVNGIALDHGQNVVHPVAKGFNEGEEVFAKGLRMAELLAGEVKLSLGFVTMVLVLVSIILLYVIVKLSQFI